MTPIFNQRILDLSAQLQDVRIVIGEDDTLHDFSQALLALALNRGVRDFLNALIEKEKVEDVVRAIPEYALEVQLALAGGSVAQPVDAIKGVSILATVNDVLRPTKFIEQDKWHDTLGAYNIEDTATNVLPYWTEFNKTIYMAGFDSGQIKYLYIKKHADVIVNGATDLILNDRFTNQLLDLAQVFVEKYAPIK